MTCGALRRCGEPAGYRVEATGYPIVIVSCGLHVPKVQAELALLGFEARVRVLSWAA